MQSFLNSIQYLAKGWTLPWLAQEHRAQYAPVRSALILSTRQFGYLGEPLHKFGNKIWQPEVRSIGTVAFVVSRFFSLNVELLIPWSGKNGTDGVISRPIMPWFRQHISSRCPGCLYLLIKSSFGWIKNSLYTCWHEGIGYCFWLW